MSARDDLVAAMEAHEKVGQVFDAAGFSADHPMFLDWARVGFALKKAVAHLDAEPFAWQPIETAPKDEAVIVYEGDAVGEARQYDRNGGEWYWANTHWTDAHDGQCFPTHWMPLPARPEASDE